MLCSGAKTKVEGGIVGPKLVGKGFANPLLAYGSWKETELRVNVEANGAVSEGPLKYPLVAMGV
jgi:hypothetical protein